MRIIIIGAVAAGSAAAVSAREQNKDAEIIIYEKDSYFSYSTCGMPYYIGGEVRDINELLPWSVSAFEEKFDVKVGLQCEVTQIDTDIKELTIKRQATKEVFTDHYDKLIIATGAQSVVPDVDGFTLQHVFTLRNINDAKKIKDHIEKNHPAHACIIGSGYVAMELLGALRAHKMKLTLVEKENQIMPKLDCDIAKLFEECLKEEQVEIIKEKQVKKITEESVIFEDGTEITSDIVFITTGSVPNVYLADQAGIKLGTEGAICTDEKMQTSVRDIFACGDCALVYSSLTGNEIYHPLAATANKTGRIAGSNAAGKEESYIGSLGTSIIPCMSFVAAVTGLTQKEAEKAGYSVKTTMEKKPDKTSVFHGKDMIIKAIINEKDHTLLGAQIIGREGVDKRIDIIAVLIMLKADLRQISQLDLCYAPPFSTVKDPIHEIALKYRKLSE